MTAEHPYRADMINAFIQATTRAFGTMSGMPAEFLGLQVRMSGDRPFEGEWICGIIGLQNRSFTGCLRLNLPEALARTIVAAILGEPPAPTITRMVIDGVGELANVISGSSKTLLIDCGVDLELGLPSRRSDYVSHPAAQAEHPCLWLNFSWSELPFSVEVALVRLSSGSDRHAAQRPALQPA
jgi:CheY-specific phosphatase CheX